MCSQLICITFFRTSKLVMVAGKSTNSSDSPALALLGKNYFLSLLPITCGVKIFPTNASFSFVTMSLLLTLLIRNGLASPGSWTLFATFILKYNYYLKVRHIEGKRDEIRIPSLVFRWPNFDSWLNMQSPSLV